MLYKSDDLQETIKKISSEQEYRPTGVAVIKNYEGNLLCVKSKKGSWHLPQGGIEPGEEMLMSAFRELSEELSINPYLELNNLEISPLYTLSETPGRLRNGFKRGKSYFFITGDYTGLQVFTPQPDELTRIEWRTPERVIRDHMIRGSHEKAGVLEELVNKPGPLVFPNFNRASYVPEEDIQEIIYSKTNPYG